MFYVVCIFPILKLRQEFSQDARDCEEYEEESQQLEASEDEVGVVCLLLGVPVASCHGC